MRWAWVVAVAVAACSGSGASEPIAKPTTTSPATTVAVVPPDAAAAAAEPPPFDAPVRASSLELAFVGDVNFGGYYDNHYDPQEVETHDPLAEMDPLLASDLTVANLETTIARTMPANGMSHAGQGNKRFVTIPERVAILLRHDLHTVTLANNHQFDNGVPGLVETPVILGELGFTAFGAARAGEPSLQVETAVVKGWRIGFVAVTTKLNRTPAKGSRPLIAFSAGPRLATDLVPLITAARRDHDLVIVNVHWGVEYSDAPEAWQVAAAHALVDAGADAVIGHHPHVMQGIERYRGAVIAYSLGNFVFPNAKDPVRDTGVLHLAFAEHEAGACLDRVSFAPAFQVRAPLTHPIPAVGANAREVQARLFRLSAAAPITTVWRVDHTRFVTDGACGP